MTGDQRPGCESPDRAGDADLARRIETASRRQELADPDTGLGKLDRLVNRAVEILGVSVLVVIVATIFVNAVGRYALDAHLLWAEELVLLLLPWLAMTGTFLAVRRGSMIRIEFFFHRMPPNVRHAISLVGYALCAGMLVFLGVISSRLVVLFGSDTSPYLDVPTGLSSMALVVGGFSVAAAFLAVLLREIADMTRLR